MVRPGDHDQGNEGTCKVQGQYKVGSCDTGQVVWHKICNSQPGVCHDGTMYKHVKLEMVRVVEGESNLLLVKKSLFILKTSQSKDKILEVQSPYRVFGLTHLGRLLSCSASGHIGLWSEVS